MVPWSEKLLDAPYEISKLTREAAVQEGMMVMKQRHTRLINRRESALTLNNSCIVTTFDGNSALLPIYIGVYRYKDKPFRIMVNGANGNITGYYPLSWVKIILAITMSCITLAILAGLLLNA